MTTAQRESTATTATKRKLTARDFVNVGIFTVLYFFVTFLGGCVGMVSPAMMLAGFAVAIAVDGTIIMLYLAKTPIFGAMTTLGLILGILMVFIPGVVIFFSVILRPGQTLLKEYQLNRIMAWLRPTEFAQQAYQQQNSIIAIGSGQLYGKGLNNNMVSSVKGGNFIAEPQTDFIFAVAGEELGFLGCCLIILLEFLIALECVRIGRRAKDLAGSLICCGMASLIMLQSFVNISVATGLMPNTGITLPFVSYGVTSLITLCMGIGIVINVGLQSRKY